MITERKLLNVAYKTYIYILQCTVIHTLHAVQQSVKLPPITKNKTMIVSPERPISPELSLLLSLKPMHQLLGKCNITNQNRTTYKDSSTLKTTELNHLLPTPTTDWQKRKLKLRLKIPTTNDWSLEITIMRSMSLIVPKQILFSLGFLLLQSLSRQLKLMHDFKLERKGGFMRLYKNLIPKRTYNKQKHPFH